jgi:hypothetical protein
MRVRNGGRAKRSAWLGYMPGVAMGNLIGYPTTMWGVPVAAASVLCELGMANIHINTSGERLELTQTQNLIPSSTWSWKQSTNFVLLWVEGCVELQLGRSWSGKRSFRMRISDFWTNWTIMAVFGKRIITLVLPVMLSVIAMP